MQGRGGILCPPLCLRSTRELTTAGENPLTARFPDDDGVMRVQEEFVEPFDFFIRRTLEGQPGVAIIGNQIDLRRYSLEQPNEVSCISDTVVDIFYHHVFKRHHLFIA